MAYKEKFIIRIEKEMFINVLVVLLARGIVFDKCTFNLSILYGALLNEYTFLITL